MNPLISIILPIYNVENYLPKCLDSLVNQTMRDIEIICVNDGSTDGSLSVLNDYASRDKRIVVINQENSGVSVARNNALAHVKGEYYMFVDSDDWLDLETCEVVYNQITTNNADCLMFTYTKEFRNHSIVNHTFSQDCFVWGKPEIQTNFHRRLFGLIEKELARPQDADLIVSAWAQLYRTDKYRHIQFVDTKIIGTEDCWYQVQVYEDCDKFVYIDKPYYHYLRTNDGSLTTKYNPNLFARWQNLFSYMENYIQEHNKGAVYAQALQNRIAISVLGAGINQAHSNDGVFEGGRHLKTMLETQRYRSALAQLNTSVMPFLWKIFFFLSKHRMTTSLFAMLKTIEYIRTHKKYK